MFPKEKEAVNLCEYQKVKMRLENPKNKLKSVTTNKKNDHGE
jgi:hypothetical protein